MRKFLASTAMAAAVFGLAAPAVFAGTGSPHFIKNATTVARSGNNLTATFKEAGLPSGAVETVQLRATGTATYECINGGGNHPQAANKETVSSQVTASGKFTADQNGNITGRLTVGPPGPGSFTCPPGQTLTGPLNVSYTNVSIVDLTSGASISFSGTF